MEGDLGGVRQGQPRRASPLELPVLVLNRSFQPVRVTTGERALVMLYTGAARALDPAYELYDFESWRRLSLAPVDATTRITAAAALPGYEAIGTPTGPLCVPRILALAAYNRVPRAVVRMSRRNVFLRDNYTCQYCGIRPAQKDLNLDHVIPRSRAGKSTWENLATSCRNCNMKKAQSTPDECGMRLQRTPARPTWSLVAQLAQGSSRYAEWGPFLSESQ